ncbi:MAG: ABC transporter permease subunit [Limnochordia bacterium]
MFNIPRPHFGGFVLTNDAHFYYFSLALAAILAVVAAILEDSKYGTAFKGVRDDELAADAIGIDSTGIKVMAFVTCGLFVGIGAGLYSSLLTYISPEVFTLEESFRFVTMVLVGGIGFLPGAIVGAVVLTFLPEMLRFLQAWYLAIYGLIVLGIVIYQPGRNRGSTAGIPRTQDDCSQEGRGSSMALLSARQATKYFGGLCAVDNLDLTVNEGEIFALIGPNGSGKTTFTNLATGMMAPTSGHVEFQGTIVSGQSDPTPSPRWGWCAPFRTCGSSRA